MIEVRDLSIRLGEFHLREINLRVEEGEYFVILGPTGAGKTVLVECIVGLHQPAQGQVFLDEREVTRLRPEERQVAYVPQDYCLFPHMTVRQNIGFGLRLRHWASGAIRERVDALAEMLHISGLLEREPLNLSGGEKQRVALARALAIEPRVLLLDEPLAAVDERTRERLCDELKAVQRQLGTTTIHVSHHFDETLAVADKIGVFDQGRIMQIGTPHDIFHRPDNEFVAAFTGMENLIAGEIQQRDGRAIFSFAGGECVPLPGPIGTVGGLAVPPAAGAAKLVIRPEELRLSGVGDSEGLAGCVKQVRAKGALVKAIVEAGQVEWTALVPQREAAGLDLAPGRAVRLHIPPEAVHLIRG